MSINDAASQGMLDHSEYKEEDIDCLSQHGISAHTFKMIQTKEHLEDEAKARNQQNLVKDEKKRELQEHIRVAESMRQLFLDKQTRSMFLNQLIDMIQERVHG